MRIKHFLFLALTLLIGPGSIYGCAAGKTAPMSTTPSIEGTYRLVARELPDGTRQGAPDVIGLMTYTNGYRNFSIMWKDSEGKLVSISLASTYKLTDTSYTENNLFFIKTVGDKVISDVSGQTRTSALSVQDGRIRFEVVFFAEPTLEFENGKFKAEGPGFVDYWEKVD